MRRTLCLLLVTLVAATTTGRCTGCIPGDSDLVEVVVGTTKRSLSLPFPSVAIGGIQALRVGASVSLTVALEQTISLLHRCVCSGPTAPCPGFMDTELVAMVPLRPAGADAWPVQFPDPYEAPGWGQLAHVMLSNAQPPRLMPGTPDASACSGYQRVTGQAAWGTIGLDTLPIAGPIEFASSATSLTFQPVLVCCCGGEDTSSNSSPLLSSVPRSLYFDTDGVARCTFCVSDADGVHDIDRVVVTWVDEGRLPLTSMPPLPLELRQGDGRIEATAYCRLTEQLAGTYLDCGPLWLAVMATDRRGHRVDAFVEISESAVLFGHLPPEIAHVVTRRASDGYDVVLQISDPEPSDTLLVAAAAAAGHVEPPVLTLGAWQRNDGGDNVLFSFAPECADPQVEPFLTVTATDAWGLSTTRRFPLPGDCLPLPRDDTIRVETASPVIINVLRNDLPADSGTGPLCVGSVAAPKHGTATHTAYRVTYTPKPGYLGEDRFTYEACDIVGRCATAEVVVCCRDASPEGPAFIALGQCGARGPITQWAETGSVLLGRYADPNGGPLSFALGAAADRPYGSLGLRSVPEPTGDGLPGYRLYLTLHEAQLGEALDATQGHIADALEVLVAEAGGSPAPFTTVEIALRNSAPIVGAVAIGTDDRTEVAIVLEASDPDGDPVQYSMDDPGRGHMERPPDFATSGTATYVPEAGQAYVERIGFRATDGLSSSKEGTVTIEVTLANRPPVAVASAPSSVAEGSVVALIGSASYDPDEGDAIAACTWEQIDGPPVELSDAHVLDPTFVAPAVSSPEGVDRYGFRLVVEDGCGEQSAPVTVSIDVTAGTASLVLDLDVAPPAVARWGEALTYCLTAHNPSLVAVDRVWAHSTRTGSHYLGSIPPGESRRVLAGTSYIVVEDDVCTDQGPAEFLSNEAWAVGVDPWGRAVASERQQIAVPIVATAVLRVTVEIDAPSPVLPWTDIDTTILLENAGDLPIEDVHLEYDTVWPSMSFGALDPGELVVACVLHLLSAAEVEDGEARVYVHAWGDTLCGERLDVSRTEEIPLD